MGRKRKPEEERKVHVGIRLPKWLVDRLLQEGSLQEMIEKTLLRIWKK